MVVEKNMVGSKLQKIIHKKRKIIVWLVAVVMVCCLGAYLMHRLNQPPIGVIKESPSSNKRSLKKASTKTLKSSYFLLKYPERYEIQSSHNKSASSESWIFIAHQALGLGQSSKISMSIVELPLGGVMEDSAYKHFSAFPELYTITTSYYSGESVVVGERTNPSFEKTVLWPHGKYLFTVSLTSAEGSQEFTAELESILRSVVWL